MDFLLKLNSLLNKSECINKNVYTDINNFIDFTPFLIQNAHFVKQKIDLIL